MSTGVEFRAIREARGLTIERIAATTRISPRMIEALERDDLTALPARPYLRGFVAAYGRELGLDPAEAVARYFAQLEPAPSFEPRTMLPVVPETRGHARAWVVTAAVIVAAIALLVTPLLNRSSVVHAPEPGAIGTAGTIPGAAGAPAATSALRPVASERSAHLQGPDVLNVSLTFHRRCWVSASTDGARVIYRIVEPGTTQTLRAGRQLTIRVGDAGAVTWSVNGRPPAPMGEHGEVRTVVVTPANWATWQ